MKKINWINYTLIAAVLFIWAGVGYYIFAAYRGDEYKIKTLRKVSPVVSSRIDSNANYTLSLNYPDPFTKKVYSNSQKNSSFNTSTDRTNQIRQTNGNTNLSLSSSNPSTAQWKESLDKISYSGRIKSGKKTIGIVRFSDVEKMVQVGEFIDVFTIENISEDSIGLKYDKKIIYVKKAK